MDAIVSCAPPPFTLTKHPRSAQRCATATNRSTCRPPLLLSSPLFLRVSPQSKLSSSHELFAMPPPLSYHHHLHQRKLSLSSREGQSLSSGSSKHLPAPVLQYHKGRDRDAGASGTNDLLSLVSKRSGVESLSPREAKASGLQRAAATTAVQSSIQPLTAAATGMVEIMATCDNEGTTEAQPCESLVVGAPTTAASLELISPVTTSASRKCLLKPFSRTAAMSAEKGRISSAPGAVTTLADAYLERQVSYPYTGDGAMATFNPANSPPASLPHVDSADQDGSAVIFAASLIPLQASKPSLLRNTPRTSPLLQGRWERAAGPISSAKASQVATFSHPAADAVAAGAAVSTTRTTATKGVASFSAALATHPTDYANRMRNMNGTVIREASGVSAFTNVRQQQQQQQSPSSEFSRMAGGRWSHASSSPYPSRTSESVADAATPHSMTATAPGSPQGSSMKSSTLRPRPISLSAAVSRVTSSIANSASGSDSNEASPRLVISAVPSLFASAVVPDALAEKKRNAADESIATCCSNGALSQHLFHRATSGATIPGSPTLFPPAAVATRAGVAMDAVGYLECERDTLRRTLARLFAAMLLPHIFLWNAVPALIPQAAAPPRGRLYAVAHSHPEVALFALELFVAGLICLGILRYRQMIVLRSSRERNNRLVGLHTSSASLAAKAKSACTGSASVAVAQTDTVSPLMTTTKTSLLLSSPPRRPGLRPLRSHGGPGRNSSAVSSAHRHRILSHSAMQQQQQPLPPEPLASVWSSATRATQAATPARTRPGRDLVNLSHYPSETDGMTHRLIGRSSSGGILNDLVPVGGDSSASWTTTRSQSSYTPTRLTPLAAGTTLHDVSEARVNESPASPAADGGAIETWSSAVDAEGGTPRRSLLRDYHHCTAPPDVPRSPQHSRERLIASGAGYPERSPALLAPRTSGSHASPFPTLPSVGHAQLALSGLGDRDCSLAKSTSWAVAKQSTAVLSTSAASVTLTDSLLLSSFGAAAAVSASSFPSTATLGRDDRVPTMTYFGFALGFLVCTSLATWRLSVDYYFALYSFKLDTNAALWYWLVPVSLLGLTAYVVLLIGGHTLRWRALRQLHDSNDRWCRKDDKEGLEEAARQMTAAAATLSRLHWIPWCLACVPHPRPDAAPLLDVPEVVITHPEATTVLPALADRCSMLSSFEVDVPDAPPPAALLTLMESSFCNGDDDAMYDDAVSVVESAQLQHSGVWNKLSKDKDEEVIVTSDDVHGLVGNILRMMRVKKRRTPAADTPSEVVSLSATNVTLSSCNPLLPQLPYWSSSGGTPTANASLSGTEIGSLSHRSTSSCFSPQSLWMLRQGLQRVLAAVRAFAVLHSCIKYVSRVLHILDFPMRLRRLCGLTHESREKRRRRQRTRGATLSASAVRRRWTSWSGDLYGLERVLPWTYLIMLFSLFQGLLSAMYFTWSWRRILREAATAAMYATDTARAVTPVPPSYAVHDCTKMQLSVRHVFWLIPPFCAGSGVNVVSPQPSTSWSMANQVALLFTLLDQRQFEVAYLYTSVALPIGLLLSMYLFLLEVRVHVKSRRVLRLLVLAKSRVEAMRKIRDATL
ncbi:hypothetical protein LPMP_040470 [Leishmania panamensis]|uniref:Transmembrane protein n=1 Tax=Leishmania panamensis TaxID=5679 RepID=A0A088RHK9_LEIPA|nr:hypothetical protein LPMP_040470 [Leishmania panamensis]AIN95373.1 hypothetical protein LPMP_040470 [Leishmania panamensis]